MSQQALQVFFNFPKPRTRVARFALAWLACLTLACGGGEHGPSGAASSGRASAHPGCENHDPLRQALFGELHVHTQLSFDANQWDVRGTPDDAYRFARGEVIEIGPAPTDGGTKPRRAQLERPLDFAAVTDHGLYLGAVSLCRSEGSAVYDSEDCRIFRGELRLPDQGIVGFEKMLGLLGLRSIQPDDAAQIVTSNRSTQICGEDGARCLAQIKSVWQEQILTAAERHNDASPACAFTTFPAYEYTATPGLAKVHRNVVFRNAQVPDTVLSYLDEPDANGLWRWLRRECLDAGDGCDVVSIPHNSNLSNGRMFTVDYKEVTLGEQQQRARLRAELEPLVEITQIKGDSECKGGMYQVVGADEFCDYEKIRSFWTEPEDCKEGTSHGALNGSGCQSRLDFVRYALIEGLREQARIGVNPYRLGITASTDAHNTNPGDAEEYSWPGWRGYLDDTTEERLSVTDATPLRGLEPVTNNPGGLTGVWAEERSRDSIFDALKRRETFGTSGPRLTARLFAGFDLDAGLCESPDLVRRGYEEGVPMGGDLPSASTDGAGEGEGIKAPTFVVSALRDPGTDAHPGDLLQRVQVVKGFVNDDGHFEQRVVDVAGGANGASVDLETCAPRGPGHEALCGAWTDPDFDPKRGAVYYARVLENPSCRWNRWQCLELPKSNRPAGCDPKKAPQTVQERLWTSPIWYEPAG